MTAFPRFTRGFVAWAPAAFALASLCLLSTSLFAAPESRDAREREREAATRSVAPVPGIVRGAPARPIGTAVVNFAELARLEALGLGPKVQPGEPRVLIRDAEENEMEIEPGANVLGPIPSEAMEAPPPFVPFVASPSPSSSFMGLDDVPMADSGYVVVPPDVAGGVGPTKVMESFNNNYRIRDKGTGATQLTLGAATFWAAVVPGALRNQLNDPRTTYDPYNNRWIACMQSVNTNGDIYVGVSQTSDPAGAWFLYRFTGFSGSYLIDFPILGFNKNWIVITINRYTTAGAFSAGICLTVNYPQARAGAGSGTLFSQAAGTHFSTAPCATISATEDTLFLVTHLSSAGATYQVDRITGTAASPVYTSGGTSTRPGGGWVQPSGNVLPQSAPNAGASACGATPCPIETQDAQVRSAPVYRVDSTTGRGFIYYTQTVGLPSPGMTHTAVQWTMITPSTTPAFADGGRIEDPTATSTNGGKWYAFPHVAVNAVGDFIVGYTQYSSAQHPAAGYSVHIASEGLGTIRDALLYHPGEDYYHKTFTTTTGRNRWGDFSTAQVDPADDRSLWVLQEYGKTRTGTDDGNTGSNSSRWSSWWANVAGPAPTVTIAPGPSVNEGNTGTTSFNFTVNLSTAYSLPVTVSFQTSDGSATVADNDYQTATSSVVIPVGGSSGTITVLVNGDTRCEGSETFTVTLTGATNGTVGSPSAATGTILNDEVSKTITATAGTGGTITPSGASSFACGASQTYTISPADKCHVILSVKVDGVSVGAVASYMFTNLQTDHTIEASFAALGPFTVTSAAGAGGAISPNGSTVVACGGAQGFTVTPNPGFVISDVEVDGLSVGVVAGYTFNDVQASHTIEASFTGNVGVEEPSFLAKTVDEGVELRWSFDGPVPPASVTLERSDARTGPWSPVAAELRSEDGTTIALDRGVAAGSTVYYRLSVTVMPGVVTSFGPLMGTAGTPIRGLALTLVAPNPASGAVQIEYAVPNDGPVQVRVLDVEGRAVAVLASEPQPRGRHHVVWDGQTARGPAHAGMYFVQLQAAGKSVVRRLALVP